MILVVLAVAVVLLVGLLACLLFCWHEPVRRGGQVLEFDRARPKRTLNRGFMSDPPKERGRR